ncbi:unnamed protein product, partial [Closterium sp. NIES-53]
MVQYRPPSARAGRFSQRAQWGLHLGIEKNYNAWKIFDIHSKETVAARDVIFYERLTLPTYLANLEENRDPTGGFRGDRHFASAADKADCDEQKVDNASDEAGPLTYCSVPIPMDDKNPRDSVNAETHFDLADTGYVTPAEVNTKEAERVGPPRPLTRPLSPPLAAPRGPPRGPIPAPSPPLLAPLLPLPAKSQPLLAPSPPLLAPSPHLPAGNPTRAS